MDDKSVGDKDKPIEKFPPYFCDKCQKSYLFVHVHCPKCDSGPQDHEVRNYDMMWHDGDVYCVKCGTYVRSYDAG